MKAKDTVRLCADKHCQPYCHAVQAGESFKDGIEEAQSRLQSPEVLRMTKEALTKERDDGFKAGYEERDKWLSPNETDRLEEAMMAGERLVVEWIEEHRCVPLELDVMVLKEDWQAQKKVWGLK